MFLKVLYVFALVVATLAQTRTVKNVFPDYGGAPAPRRNHYIPGFEGRRACGKANRRNLVLPNFEDEDPAQNSNESGHFTGEGSGSITSFPVHIQTTGSNEFQRTTEEIIAENTGDLPGKTTTSPSVTRPLTRRPGLHGLFNIFDNAAQEVVKENADRFNDGINAILGAGESILHATNNMHDAKKTIAASIPRGWHKVFTALNKRK